MSKAGLRIRHACKIPGCLENELGLRRFLEDRGHTYVVTDDKEGENSQFEKELADADVVRPSLWHGCHFTGSLMVSMPHA